MRQPDIPTAAQESERQIQAALAHGEHRAAWAEMSRLMSMRTTAATCQVVADGIERLDPRAAELTEVRLALLANFTIDPLAPILTARGVTSTLALRVYVPGFDVWAQEILDSQSELRGHNSDVIVVALMLEALCPRLAGEFLGLTRDQVAQLIDETAARVEEIVRNLRGWSSARILLHSFASPEAPALGILDRVAPHGQTAAIRSLNERLAMLSHSLADVFIVDCDRVIASVGHQQWHERRLWAVAKMPFTLVAMHALAEEYLRYLRAFTGRIRKVLVLDADDTLWSGIVGEMGRDAISLGPEYPGNAFVDIQRAVLEWHRRGVILALNTKNDGEDVTDVLEHHPAMILRPEHIAAMRINWQDKAVNMVELADELDLGLDSFVFVDDSEVECERMRQALPEVLAIHLAGEPALRAATIRNLGVFDSLRYGDEDRARGALYRTDVERRRLERTLSSIEDFYRSLDMALQVEPAGPAALSRAADLTQRTNQFNLTTRRYTEDELARALVEPGCEAFVFRLKDRFGEHGIIGFAMLEGAGRTLTISSLLLSCRVLKRTVEHAMVAFLVARARERGALQIDAVYRPTRKNRQARDFYPALGFAALSIAEDGAVSYRLPATHAVAPSPWIRLVRCETTTA